MPAPNTDDHDPWPCDVASLFAASKWIWPDHLHWDLHNCYALFRREFSLSRLPREAIISLTADQSYQLYVNGQYICRGPARGYQKHWPYDEADIRPALRKGRNVIAIRAYNPGHSNFQYLTQGYAGLLVALKLGAQTIVSDQTWRGRRQSGVQRDTMPSSVQLFCQEHIDLREENPAWMEPDFDDSSWKVSMAEQPWSALPWQHLEARGLPLLDEHEIAPAWVIGKARGRSACGYESPRDVSRVLAGEGLTHRPTAADSPIVIPPTGPRKWRRILLDFGHTVVGSLGLRIRGASGGEIIDTFCSETIDAKTLAPHHQPDEGSRPAFSQRLVCPAGDFSHTFYHVHGFRYLTITVRDSSTTLEISPFVRTAIYPLNIKGTFQSSDGDLNKIWQACVRTQQQCSLDAYVDTPWREQAQWWGDARVQAWNTFYLAADDRLLRRGIRSLAGQQTPDGLTYGHAPTMAHNCVLPDFSLIWLLTLWDHYWQTGSTEIFATQQKVVEDVLHYFKASLHPKLGLARHDPRHKPFLDWTALYREGCPAVLNLWLLITLERLSILYTLTGNRRQALSLKRWARQLRQAILLLVNGQGLLRDGCDEQGRPVKETSIHAQTLALMANLNPASEDAMMRRVLIPFIREEKTFAAKPSAYWITYVFTTLQERGYGAEVVAYIRRHWQAMGEYGTTWENFAPKLGVESFSHAWSAHPIYHFAQILGGIRQTSPSWRTIDFRPSFLTANCEVAVPTPLGTISSRWHVKGRQVDLSLDLPPGLEATAFLPGRRKQIVQKHLSSSFELPSSIPSP